MPKNYPWSASHLTPNTQLNSQHEAWLLLSPKFLLKFFWDFFNWSSIVKEISPGISLEGMMQKLKLQYFGHLMRRVDSWKRLWCWEGLGAGGEGDDRGWDGWMASPTQWTWIWVNSGSWWWTGRPGLLRFMGSQSRTRLSDWTELNWRAHKHTRQVYRKHFNGRLQGA